MIFLDIEVDDDSLNLILDRIDLGLAGTALSAFLQGGGAQILQERAAARFAGEGDDASGPWAPLRPRTQTVRRGLGIAGIGPSHPINRRTGELRGWITKDPGSHAIAGGDIAYMVWPGEAPSAGVEKKFGTAQVGASKPATVDRPVAKASPVDMRLLLSGLGEWVESLTGLEFS